MDAQRASSNGKKGQLMEFAPYANWELIGYVCVWAFLSICAGLMIEYFENKKVKKSEKSC